MKKSSSYVAVRLKTPGVRSARADTLFPEKNSQRIAIFNQQPEFSARSSAWSREILGIRRPARPTVMRPTAGRGSVVG
ncbi:hypothetical protein [Streptomyces mirabilis]|jgi:hypothetical protein|uniref:hypothetical protein n=1 Tax=Streptomyces mirabilis TaxID=68239 RepID=UPI0011600C27|nr:hypothetical protein [Streptomyces mirabilis]